MSSVVVTMKAPPWLLAAAGCACVVITATPSLGGYNLTTLFAWHAVLLTASVAVLLPAGLLAYGGSAGGGARLRHIVLMSAAAALAAAGYAAGYVAHSLGGKDHLALNRGNLARTAHVWLGLAALAALAVQAAGGAAAAARLYPSLQHVAWGRVIWGLAVVPLALAVFFRWFQLGNDAVGALLALLLAGIVGGVATNA